MPIVDLHRNFAVLPAEDKVDDKTKMMVAYQARGMGDAHAAALRSGLGDEELARLRKGRPPRRPIGEDEMRIVAEYEGEVVYGESLGRLRSAQSAPLCVYARGATALLQAPRTVGIVGTRRPSARGRNRAQRLGAFLARAGIVVVSGGAMGIDCAAHEGALLAGGKTIFVLGDIVRAGDERPARVRRLVAPAKERALTITAHGPWTKQSRGLFVSRNRLIAALSDIVVVVEGRRKSGTAHTAEYARKLGTPIFAVPGDPDDELAATPNWLIAEGRAKALLRFADLGVKEETVPQPSYPPVEAAVLRALARAGGRLDVTALVAMTSQNVMDVLAATSALEIEGEVIRDGAAFVRVCR